MQCAIIRYFTRKLHKHNKTCSSAWADTRYSIRLVYGPRRKKCAAYAEYRISGERLVRLRCIWGLRQRHERAKERGDIPALCAFSGSASVMPASLSADTFRGASASCASGFASLRSALDTAGLEAGDEVFLAADEHYQHRHEARDAHGEHIAPLRELVLAEEAGDGYRQRAFGVVVDDRHGPGELLPGGQEVEDAHGGDGRARERADDLEEHREHAPAVHIHRLVIVARDALDVALYHEGREGYDPGDVEGHEAEELVRELEEGGELVLRYDERRARDYHRADDEAEEQLAARETESREAEGQRRGDEGRDEHGEYRDRRAV